MLTFKIQDTFKITDRGYVLTGYIIDNSSISPGDKVVITIDTDPNVFKVIGVSVAKQPRHYGLLISFEDFEKVSTSDLKEKEVKIINILDRKKLTADPIKFK